MKRERGEEGMGWRGGGGRKMKTHYFFSSSWYLSRRPCVVQASPRAA